MPSSLVTGRTRVSHRFLFALNQPGLHDPYRVMHRALHELPARQYGTQIQLHSVVSGLLGKETEMQAPLLCLQAKLIANQGPATPLRVQKQRLGHHFLYNHLIVRFVHQLGTQTYCLTCHRPPAVAG